VIEGRPVASATPEVTVALRPETETVQEAGARGGRTKLVKVKVAEPVEAEPQPPIEEEPLIVYDPLPSALWFTAKLVLKTSIEPGPLKLVEPLDQLPAGVVPEPPEEEAKVVKQSMKARTLTVD
jgi:hypothetical protein